MSTTKKTAPLGAAQIEKIAGLFKMLGEPMRLRILQAVCHGPRPVGEIVEQCGSTQANVSKHLALLAAAGILQREKQAQRVFYRVQEPLVLKLCELVRAQWLAG
jgi:DNA-binding transcriptional ArsR family regulator